MPVFPPLVSPEELLDLLGDERLRIFDATVVLSRAVAGGPYVVQSGRPGYERAHIPGAAFAAEEYWGRPVPGFGDPAARIAILGLAPAALVAAALFRP